jgi:hypothetical protein
MSQQNDETKGMIMAFAFIGAILYALAIFALVALTFVSIVMTIVCLFAWNEPRRMGKYVLMPDEARSFVKRGFVGAMLLPLFCIFLELYANVRINGDYVVHIALAGYMAGSLGIEIIFADEKGKAEPTQTIIPPCHQIAPPQQHEPPRIPFRFASWDDEDGR